jgi:hypothetical protein
MVNLISLKSYSNYWLLLTPLLALLPAEAGELPFFADFASPVDADLC